MTAERNLLFGVLALQTDLIESAQLAEARSVVAEHPETALPAWLVERGWITAEDRLHLEYLLVRKLQRHGEDARACLAAAAPSLLEAGDGLTPSCDLSADDFGNLTPPPPLGGPGAARSESGFAATIVTGPLPAAPAWESKVAAGRYAYLQLHATGGIGRVWLTRDGTLGRQVALKELRPETADHPRMRARFLEEARITGQLEHPGIVPVYELARHSDSQQPFYTMRFVKGRTLTQAIRDYHQQRKQGTARSLDLRSLLNAFVAICNTLAYAHARGVIHRDLKGQNVVLGDFGEVIVLDWGLAKLLEQREATADLPAVALEVDMNRDETLQGMVLGTPAYMAPEQAAGDLERIDTRTDVYGLGAILYEILTGQPPFTGSDTNDLLRKVQQETPQRPGQLVPGLPPALEAVCLKALAHTPGLRYAAAADLAGDIQRWLADEPVSAWREPWRARLGRWARRHKPLVSGAGALLCTAVVALAISTILIGRQKARAEENFQLARDAVERFYVRVSEEQLLQEPGLQPLRKSLLETARDFFQRFVEENVSDSGRQADLGKTLVKLARITGEIGAPSEAVQLLQRAEGILEELVQRQPGNLELRHELATCRNVLGVRCRELGRWQEADLAYQQAIESAQPLAELPEGTPEYRRTLGLGYNNRGMLCRELGRREEAEKLHRAAILLQEKLVEQHPEDLRFRSDLGGSFNNLAALFSSLNKPADAAVELYRALDLWNRPDARSAEQRENLAMGHYNLAILYTGHSLHEWAWNHSQIAVQQYESLAAGSPAVTRYRHKLARAYLNLGNILEQFGESARLHDRAVYLAEAHRGYLAAQRLLDQLTREHPRVATFIVARAGVAVSLGNLSGNAGQWPTALEWYQLAVTYLDEAGEEVARGPDAHRSRMQALWGQADALAQLNRHADALPVWDRAIPLASGRQRAFLRTGRALSLARLGEHARAAKEATETAAAHADQPLLLVDLARALSLSVTAAQRQDQPAVADEYAAAAVRLLERAKAAKVLRDAAVRQQLLKGKDFEALWPNQEFQKLLEEAGPVQQNG